MIGRVALVLVVAAAGVFGLWAMTGIAAAMGITALLNAYPRKVRR